MATSYATYTGGSYTTAAIYTVPSGKVAKIIVTYLRFGNSNNLYIGEYQKFNSTGQLLRSDYGSGNAGTSTPVFDVPGMLTCRSSNSSFLTSTIVIKDTHILVAGETVYFSSSTNNTIKFTVIEEDV